MSTLQASNSLRDSVEPPVDVYENAEALLLLVDLPGVGKDDLAIEVKGPTLSLHATRGELAPFERNFRLPDVVDQAKIRVALTDGVARIELPKQEKAKPVRIPVQ